MNDIVQGTHLKCGNDRRVVELSFSLSSIFFFKKIDRIKLVSKGECCLHNQKCLFLIFLIKRKVRRKFPRTINLKRKRKERTVVFVSMLRLHIFHLLRISYHRTSILVHTSITFLSNSHPINSPFFTLVLSLSFLTISDVYRYFFSKCIYIHQNSELASYTEIKPL